MNYVFSIKNTYHFYGYPQTEDHYTIDNNYVTINLKRYGNQGYDAPVIIAKSNKCNGYFWTVQAFMKAMYKDYKLQNLLSEIRIENMIKAINISDDGTIKIIK